MLFMDRFCMDALPFSMKENRLELRVSANPYDKLIATILRGWGSQKNFLRYV